MLEDSRTAAFNLLPLTFHGLVIESTNRCNAKCAMCYQSSGPKGSDDWGRFRLDSNAIKRAARSALTIPSIHPRFHLAGGEAFIYSNECFELISFARDCGYKYITATSNCFWAQNSAKAKKFSSTLSKCGLTQMEVSWDFWHMPFIDPKCIDNAILALSDHGIYVNLRVLTTIDHGTREALASLSQASISALSEISSGPVFPTGRAAKEIARDEFHYSHDLSGSCHSVLHLTVNARGDVYPCCAGADQTDALSYGNIACEDISTIYERMNSDPLLRVLVFFGVGALAPLIAAEHPVREENYASICHLCWDIFSSPILAAKVKDHFQNMAKRHELDLIRLISETAPNAM